MRQITQDSVNAFFCGQNFSKANMTVKTNNENETRLFLHGNMIAKKTKDSLQISNCGWYTNTTKERLNGVLHVYGLGYIYQKNHNWYYVDNDGQEQEFNKEKTFNI
ncbi:MAG: hypothetical protein HRU18_26020 [Pseudoalteromonas sp.]|uniref:hypothetical protein n=1 Tax=Pseudoalteromonas sp. TaxID=53249 RepID=UPI001D8F4AE3|nr:hypothetical protein [Pseudoalteromonas sp.]NRA81671.1 hypothetical protein [Pseudoalteromonas sp.]